MHENLWRNSKAISNKNQSSIDPLALFQSFMPYLFYSFPISKSDPTIQNHTAFPFQLSTILNNHHLPVLSHFRSSKLFFYLVFCFFLIELLMELPFLETGQIEKCSFSFKQVRHALNLSKQSKWLERLIFLFGLLISFILVDRKLFKEIEKMYQWTQRQENHTMISK